VFFIGSIKSLFYTAIVCFIIGIFIGTYATRNHPPLRQTYADTHLETWCDAFKCDFDGKNFKK
jgi:hypothetical protein